MIERLFFDFKRFDFSRVGRYKINQRLGLDVANTAENRVMRLDDLVAIISEIIRLNNTQEPADDIDALSNRRVKLVGELVARQFRIGMLRMQRNAMDRMSMSDLETVTPNSLINARPVVAAVREFFASSQLSQFMDQTNPLSELSHKRRLSSMGPGGLSRERAGLEVRDVHQTHYGRLCSVETPEGANIGLVLNMASYAKVNEYGFLETPYIKVKNGKVTNEIVYLDAAQEAVEVIAAASSEVDKSGKFTTPRVSARKYLVPEEVDIAEVTYIDAAKKQILGSTASLIPFIEKNRIDRSLTGSNMQKQAVPLLDPQSPIVGTGVEASIARNTSQLIVAEADGEVTKADADEVIVKYKKDTKTYRPVHFEQSNDDRSINQKVVVSRGKLSEYGRQLLEKQKACLMFGVQDKRLRAIYSEASRTVGQTDRMMRMLLERRLDNVLFRAGYAQSRIQARQFVSHGLFTVNGVRVTVASYQVKVGDKIQVRENKKSSPVFAPIVQAHERYTPPEWLKSDPSKLSAEVVLLPTEDKHLDQSVDMRKVIGFYSR
jgi:DNA-directed RNA polymerase subunit beta